MCDCTSCKYTDSFAGWAKVTKAGRGIVPKGNGFADWPRGWPAGKRASERAYTLHVAHSHFGALKRVGVGPIGAAFYGVPAGSTRAEVERVLREAFRFTPFIMEGDPDAPIERVQKPSLLAIARQLRIEARASAAQAQAAA
mgnify:CR=1 FL=1